MTMVRCDSCTGKKMIIGLGNIMRKCGKCKGLGFCECTDINKVEAKAGLMIDDKVLDLVYNDSLPSVEQKKNRSKQQNETSMGKEKSKTRLNYVS